MAQIEIKLGSRRGKVEVFQSKADGLWYWHLLAGNGHVVAGALEGYSRKAHCKRMAREITGGAYNLSTTVELGIVDDR